ERPVIVVAGDLYRGRACRGAVDRQGRVVARPAEPDGHRARRARRGVLVPHIRPDRARRGTGGRGARVRGRRRPVGAHLGRGARVVVGGEGVVQEEIPVAPAVEPDTDLDALPGGEGGRDGGVPEEARVGGGAGAGRLSADVPVVVAGDLIGDVPGAA